MPLNYEKKTDTLKTPEEYGIPSLQRMYTALYEQWFAETGDVMGVEFPSEVDFAFGKSADYLGEFHANIQYRTAPDGAIHRMTATDPEIEFSNQFRLTPFQLMNVMAHEMIHLLLTLVVANMANEAAREGDPDALYYRQQAEDDMGHGDEFKKLAKEINDELGLQVTVTNDQPIIQDGPSAASPSAETVHLLVTPADTHGDVNVVGMSETNLRKAVMKAKESGMPFRVLATSESHVIMKYMPDSADMVKTSTVTESYLGELEDSGVIADDTKKYAEDTGSYMAGKLLCVSMDGQVMLTRCGDETAGTAAAAIAAATRKPVGIYGVTDKYDGDAAAYDVDTDPDEWKSSMTASSAQAVEEMVDEGKLLPEAEVSPDGKVTPFSE